MDTQIEHKKMVYSETNLWWGGRCFINSINSLFILSRYQFFHDSGKEPDNHCYHQGR